MEQQPKGDILDALQSGDIVSVKKFLDEGVTVDLSDEEGWSLLHHAAALGQVEVINLLREKGYRVDLIDNKGRTPFHYAVINGDIETIRLLIMMGSNVNSVDNEGNTPLKLSVMFEQNTAIEELTKHGGTVEIEEVERSADNLNRPAIPFLLQILGDGNNEVCQSNQTELSTDIQHVSTAGQSNDSYKHSDHNSRQTNFVKTQQCMDSNADTTQLEGDIFEAAQCGDTATVKGYLDLGVPVDVTDEDGWFPVHHAIAHRQVEVIRLLMDRGCLMNPVKSKKYLSKEKQVTHTSEATIFKAAQCGDTATMKGCLDLGVPVDVTDEDGWSPVHHAIAHRQVEVIRLLMDRGCLMNPVKSKKYLSKEKQVTHTSEATIFEAAQCGDTATMKGCLDLGVPVDVTDEDGWSPVHHAIAHRQVAAIRLLMDRGCLMNPVKNRKQATKGSDLHITTESGSKYSTYTEKQLYGDIFKAARCGDTATIQSYLNSGGPVDLTDEDGRTLLHCAAGEGQIKVVELLIKRGCRIDPADKNGWTPSIYATACGHVQTVVQLIKQQLSEQYLLDSVDNQGLLHFAAQYGLIHMIEILAEQGLNVNIGDDKGRSPLHYAVAYGQLESVRALLRLGGRESMTKVAGKCGTPLHQAVAEGHKDIVSLLLNEGCPINVVDSRDRSVLHYAAAVGQIHMIKMFSEQGLDVNKADTEGMTPLHAAAACGQLKSMCTLLRLGGRASMTKVAGTGGTPLHQAVAGGHKDIVSLLLNEGCPITVVNSEGRSVLHFAAQGGEIHMVEMLAKQGLKVNIGDDEGLTPLHAAAACGQTKVLHTLLRLGGRKSMIKEAVNAGTPLHQAVGKGHKDIVSLLLNEGCPINVVDSIGRSALHFAAQFGQNDMIEMLAEQGLDVNIGDDKGLTPLHSAATYGQLESVLTLLRLGGRESMTKVAGAGGTPLHQAVGKGHKDIVSLLLNEGCPINVVNSVLRCAAQYGQAHMIEMLVEHGLDVNVGTDGGWTPLHAAVVYGQPESVRTLLRLGGRESMTKEVGAGGTPLHYAVAGGHEDIVSLLLNEGSPINVVDRVLHCAAQYGQVHMIEMLVEHGLDVNIGADGGWTPLHYAATCGQLKSVRTLLRLGGRESMTKVAGAGGTPLHQAVAGGHKDIVSLLLNEGCPINVVNSDGSSVLLIAAAGGQIHMIKMFSEQGLDVNKANNEGMTPLHAAAICGQLESVRTLLRLGGRESMTKVAGTGGTPLHQAVEKGHKDIVSLLLNEGCPITVVNSEGKSVLHFAAQGCQIDMIEMLAEQGLDVNIGDDEGLTPLHYAAERGHITTFNGLVSVGGDIHLMDKFGMKCSDYTLIRQNFVTVIQFCVACGLECDNEDLLGVISALSANNLLDMSKILCLAAVRGDISIFDAMVTSPYPLNQQKMPKIAICLSSISGGKNLPDQFHISEEPLNPLHISILSEYFSMSQNIKFIEKLTSHPRTGYTVNELFPNGLSPLDVARRFELHDIAAIIERAGGGPGAWADLPKEIVDKAIDLFTSLKELKGRELGEDVTARIWSMLGYPLVNSDQQEVKKILEEKPKRSLLQKIVLSSLKYKRKWERVGDLLEVNEDILKNIGEEAADDDDAYYSMLKYWLEHGCNVSWKTLLDAVGDFETKKTVDHITDKIVEELAPSQVSIQIGSFHCKLQTCVVLHIYTTT